MSERSFEKHYSIFWLVLQALNRVKFQKRLLQYSWVQPQKANLPNCTVQWNIMTIFTNAKNYNMYAFH